MVSVCFPRKIWIQSGKQIAGAGKRGERRQSGPASIIPCVSERPQEARPGKHLVLLSFHPHSLSKNNLLSFTEILSQQSGDLPRQKA